MLLADYTECTNGSGATLVVDRCRRSITPLVAVPTGSPELAGHLEYE